MPHPVTLPRLAWGELGAPRRALLVHGLGSNGALMWRFGVALAEAGWHAEAVDLRGHGTAPRALDYTIEAYASDLAHARPERGGAWDLVIGHSLGGAAATTAAAADADWARRLVLVDPAIRLDEGQREAVGADFEGGSAQPSVADIAEANPHWHPQDAESKATAARQVSAWAGRQTTIQNAPWDVRGAAARLTVPTRIIGADPAVHSLFTGAVAEAVLANPAIEMVVIAGAGHSVHRDRPDETLEALFAVLD
jgi:pimeloyl-ACP methyl ester carboxylesterase